jgi:oligosaccharide repeat unit polymerase
MGSFLYQIAWKAKHMPASRFEFRKAASLPFYCDPLKLFIAIWMVMLGSLEFHISDVTYPNMDIAFLLFLGSCISFLMGYVLVRLVYQRSKWRKRLNGGYEINITRLRRFIFILSCIASVIILLNLLSSGLPPLLGFFGFSTESYTAYGRFKQLLFPILMTVFVDSFLDTSNLRKILYGSFAFLCMLCYVARGAMMLMLFQALIVFSIRTSISKKKIYLISIFGALAAAFFVDIVGSNRTGDQLLFLGMQIRAQAQTWPTIYIWIISYISAPISNLCWFVDFVHFQQPTLSFLYPLLPAFWTPVNPHLDVILTPHIIDGVHTYLASYYLDLSYPGIFMINFCLGVASGYMSMGRRIGKMFLTCSVFLASLGFIFFWDFFVYLPTVIQFLIQMFAQKYIIRQLKHRPG